jgi:hypothetical protein
MALSIENNE